MRWGYRAARAVALGIVAISLQWPLAVSAQSIPRPVEFYFDEDRQTTRAFEALDESQVSAAGVQTLLRQPVRDRRAAEALGRIAHTAYNTGRADLGRTLYERALTDLGQNHGTWRQMLWNFAWDLQRNGENEAALARWIELVGARASRAAWMPPTMALAAWRADRREDALRWYAAAVRTEPGLWTSPDDFSSLLPAWRAQDRATLGEVQAAWAANPPAWP